MPFPHPVRSFAGRRAELDRMLAHVESDVLFFVYGLGGMGKTELVYQLVRELRARSRWADALPVLVEVAPGSTTPRLLAQLLTAVGAAPAPRRGQPTEEAYLSAQLAKLASRLDARPHLLVIDDVHHLPAPPLAEALAHLSRHVQASRLIVVSRREVVLPAGAPAPVVTTVGPLDPAAAEQMMIALADRLDVPRPDPGWLMRATHGSPFHIQRLLARPQSGSSSLEASLDELTPPAQHVLRVIAVARHRPSRAMMRRTWSGPGSLDAILDELAERFVLDRAGDGLAIHDLVREAALGRATPDELVAAHGAAAALCLGELATPNPSLLFAIDAVHHAMAAGRHADAWQVVERWHHVLAAAGTEHLMFEMLEQLREALPERRNTIDLRIARCLLRASMFDDAARVLARVREPRGADEADSCVVAGEIALRAGNRELATTLFEQAIASAPDPGARFDARLRRASVSILDGEGARTRELLATALAELRAPTARQRARAGWARTASWMFDERYEEAADEARRAALELAPRGVDDLANQLAMLETLAAIECEDMERARAAARRIDEAGLRNRVAALYRAIVRYADGDARDASAELVAAHAELRDRGDPINAYLAGYYGSAALAEIGSLGQAQTLADQTAQLAEHAGLHGMAARSLAQQAMLAAEAIQSGLAHRLADAALARAHLGPRSRAVAHCAHARAYTLEGDTVLAVEHIALARAAVEAPALVAPRAAIDIEHAAVALVAGNLDHAVELGERVVERHCGRDYEAAHARLVLAAAYIARGRRTDLVFGQRTLEHARALADRGALRSVQVGCAILSAALARRSQRDRVAGELLAEALRELDPERGSIYAGTLVAAIDGGAASRLIPGAVALLGHLGFTETVDCYLVDARARRAATEKDVARECTERELFVDELRDVIVARHGDVEIRGRPMLCALLSVLVQARGAAVTPDTLYTRVWGVTEYHPLQHRNALYVAINRLRSSLREVFPERDLIERASAGWRLADGVDAAVAVRGPAKTM